MAEIIIITLKKYWKSLLGVIALVLSFLGIYLKGKSVEKAKAHARDNERIVNEYEKILEIRRKDDVTQINNRKIADDILHDPHSGFDS